MGWTPDRWKGLTEWKRSSSESSGWFLLCRDEDHTSSSCQKSKAGDASVFFVIHFQVICSWKFQIGWLLVLKAVQTFPNQFCSVFKMSMESRKSWLNVVTLQFQNWIKHKGRRVWLGSNCCATPLAFWWPKKDSCVVRCTHQFPADVYES